MRREESSERKKSTEKEGRREKGIRIVRRIRGKE